MVAGRITQRTISDTAVRGLQGNLSRMQKLQEELSSGRKVSTPSDDPSATVSAMTLRSRRAADEQYLRNIDLAAGRLSITDNTLTQLSDRLREIRGRVIEARNGALGKESLAAIASNVDAVRSEVLDLFNTTYLDRPVFGGSVKGLSALDPAGNFIGDTNPVEVRITTDAVLRIDVSGTAVGADTVPAMLTQIAANIAAGNAGPADIDALDGALSRVANTLGEVGARTERLSKTRDIVDSHRLDLTSRISVQEDVDLPESIMNLEAQRTGYQAALQAAAKIQQISLVDFLK